MNLLGLFDSCRQDHVCAKSTSTLWASVYYITTFTPWTAYHQNMQPGVHRFWPANTLTPIASFDLLLLCIFKLAKTSHSLVYVLVRLVVISKVPVPVISQFA